MPSATARRVPPSTGSVAAQVGGATPSSTSKPEGNTTLLSVTSPHTCTCSPATAPPGLTYRPATSRSPPDSSVPTRTTRSPATGFSNTSLTLLRSWLRAAFSRDDGDVYAAQPLHAQVLGEDQEAHVDVVLEPSEVGLSARREDGGVVEDADRCQDQNRYRHYPPGPDPVRKRHRRQPEAERVEDPEGGIPQTVPLVRSGERDDRRVGERERERRRNHCGHLGAVRPPPVAARCLRKPVLSYLARYLLITLLPCLPTHYLSSFQSSRM